MNSPTQRRVVYSLAAASALLAAGVIFSQDSLRPQEKHTQAKCAQDGKAAQPPPKNVKDPLKVLLRGIIL